jgi:SAM-dependent methyltransferase
MDTLQKEETRRAVRERYAQIAGSENSDCGCSPSCCGEDSTAAKVDEKSLAMGYSPEEVSGTPEGANMGLGCGNPTAIASLKPGETVLDLGSGGGFDCFLAAKQVGDTGKVIGVDMTPEMISKARQNALKGKFFNVEFRLGEIEHLPAGDNSVDVIISNCVINLSPEKPQVFKEAFRVLKKEGRLAISDVVATAPLPEHVRNDLSLYTGCISGASQIDELEEMMKLTGFIDIRIAPKDESKTFIREWAPGRKIDDYIVSASIEAVKP